MIFKIAHLVQRGYIKVKKAVQSYQPEAKNHGSALQSVPLAQRPEQLAKFFPSLLTSYPTPNSGPTFSKD